MTEIAPYFDPILTLVSDPNLNREKSKTEQLISIINGFPLAERRISKLCTLSFQILKDLERIELKTKNWAFLSLDINSENHFNDEATPIKKFNHDLAKTVLGICQDLHKILYDISIELDNITNSIQNLTPLEYISDSGTLLTKLCLRNIKLKNDLSDKVSTAYSKSKLISIGDELEHSLSSADSSAEDLSIIQSYKSFVASLMKQLNVAIEQNDQATKNECMAVVTDVEKMFDAYKLEKAQNNESNDTQEKTKALSNDENINENDDIFEEYPTTPVFLKSSKSKNHGSPINTDDTLYDFNDEDRIIAKKRSLRRSSISSLSTSSTLQKTTITDELPYLLNAFDSAKHIEEDISVYLTPSNENKSRVNSPPLSSSSFRGENREKKKHELNKRSSFTADNHIYNYGQTKEHDRELEHPSIFHYPDSSNLLHQQSAMLNPNMIRSPSIFNSSNLLSKFGIKPQVITTPKSTFSSMNFPSGHFNRQIVPSKSYSNLDSSMSEKRKSIGFPLTKANLNSINEQNDKLKHNDIDNGNEYIDIDDLVE